MSPIELGSLILHTGRLDAVVAFYRLLGLPLALEDHGEGPPHYACELGGIHVAIYEAQTGSIAHGDATPWRFSGSTWPGFATTAFDAVVQRLHGEGVKVLSGPEERPWGMRIVVQDPDGRPVEVWSK